MMVYNKIKKQQHVANFMGNHDKQRDFYRGYNLYIKMGIFIAPMPVGGGDKPNKKNRRETFQSTIGFFWQMARWKIR